MPAATVVWFRRDLRTRDHPALRAAVERGGQVVPLFVIDPRLAGPDLPGASRRAFLGEALGGLDADLRRLGSRLHLRTGDPAAVVPAVAREAGAQAVHCSREFTPFAARRDRGVAAALGADGRALREYGGSYLADFDAVRPAGGEPFRVYTPFSRTARAAGLEAPMGEPSSVPTPADIATEPLPSAEAFGVLDAVRVFPASSAAGHERLAAFAGRSLGAYADRRDQLAEDGTSRLSPYLHLGLLSPREVAAAADGNVSKGASRFLDELLWRDFYAYVLHHDPGSLWQDFRRDLSALAWREDPQALAAWTAGRTGYPLVDAAMRQLRTEGWLHNRGRLVVASFLCKDLLLHWTLGSKVFLDHLVDGDVASNNGGWQWAASTGTDPQPYFRVFNPVNQAQRFDPDGDYVRRHLPELALVKGPAVFEPWKMDAATQRAAGCVIGKDYPAPIVDHATARKRALTAFESARSRG